MISEFELPEPLLWDEEVEKIWKKSFKNKLRAKTAINPKNAYLRVSQASLALSLFPADDTNLTAPRTINTIARTTAKSNRKVMVDWRKVFIFEVAPKFKILVPSSLSADPVEGVFAGGFTGGLAPVTARKLFNLESHCIICKN